MRVFIFTFSNHIYFFSIPDFRCSTVFFFISPTSKKLRAHIGLGLSICQSVRLSVTPFVVGCKTREPFELGT